MRYKKLYELKKSLPAYLPSPTKSYRRTIRNVHFKHKTHFILTGMLLKFNSSVITQYLVSKIVGKMVREVFEIKHRILICFTKKPNLGYVYICLVHASMHSLS